MAHLALTPSWGARGAAVATFIGYGTVALITYVLAQRVHPLPYRGPRLAVLFVLAASLAWAVQRAAPAGAVGVGLKLLATVAVAAGTVLLGLWTNRGAVARLPGNLVRE
jgi:O-antigen/teichoic acid export membrane protein